MPKIFSPRHKIISVLQGKLQRFERKNQMKGAILPEKITACTYWHYPSRHTRQLTTKNVHLSSVAASFVLDYADDSRRYNFALIDSLQVAYTLLSVEDAGQLRAISHSLHGGEVVGRVVAKSQPRRERSLQGEGEREEELRSDDGRGRLAG